MRKTAFTLLVMAQAMESSGALAQAAALDVKVNGFDDGGAIPATFAYCQPDKQGKTTAGGNVNPEIRWSAAPTGTRSLALIVVDKDVPKTFELANQEGKTIPASFPRRDFYHWVLVDIPAGTERIPEGIDSRGVSKGSKQAKTEYGLNGHNDYSVSNLGYDGPCPPWNDERIHHYHFIVYALDVPSLNLKEGFGGKEAEAAIAGHVLAKGEVVGTYSNLKR